MRNTSGYQKITLTRQDGELIEIGSNNGIITSFFEEYRGMGANYISSYVGADTERIIDQLKSYDWRIDGSCRF